MGEEEWGTGWEEEDGGGLTTWEVGEACFSPHSLEREGFCTLPFLHAFLQPSAFFLPAAFLLTLYLPHHAHALTALGRNRPTGGVEVGRWW